MKSYQELQRKVRVANFASFPFWIIIIAYIKYPMPGYGLPLAAISSICILSIGLYKRYFIKCQECKVGVGEVMSSLSQQGKKRMNFCPNCGKNFNEGV
jgi:hypothetical protein